MRFRMEHSFDAPRDLVEQAVLDPAFHERLEDLPNVGHRSVVSTTTHDDGTVEQVITYRFEGHLPGPVKSALGGEAVSWDEHATFDPAAHTWTFEVRPHVFAHGFHCEGVQRYMEENDRTVRVIEGELNVRVPIVGGRVEAAIVDGLTESVDAEAQALSDHLRERMETTR